MGYEISVSPEQLLAGADALRAMADEYLTEPADDSAEEHNEASSSRHLDGFERARARQADALSDATRQLARTIEKASDTLRAAARDYQQTEASAAELIERAIGRDLGGR